MALVHDKLRKLRDDNKLKGRHIFKAIEMDYIDDSEISEYFNGTKRRNLQEDILEKLAVYFNVDLDDYLLNDKIDVLDNPEQDYPYISREDKEAKRLEELQNLKIKVNNFTNIDKEFKKDTIELINKLTENIKELNKLFKIVDRNVDSISIKNIVNYGILNNSQYHSFLQNKILKTFNDIIIYFNNSDAVSFYQATKSLRKIELEINKLENFLFKANDLQKRIDRITEHASKIKELLEMPISLYNNLVECSEVNDNKELFKLMEQFPDEDTLSIVNIYFLIIQKQFYDSNNDYFEVDCIDENYFLNVVNNYRLQLVYSDGMFLLDSNPDTLERLYRFIIECHNDELVIKYIDKEYERLQKEFGAWTKKVELYLKNNK